MITRQQLKLGFPNLDQKYISTRLRFLSIFGLIGLDLKFHFRFSNPFFYQTYLRCYCKYLVRPSFVMYIFSENTAGDRLNQFWPSWLLTEHQFCRKLLMNISIDNRYCNFIYLLRQTDIVRELQRCFSVFTILELEIEI